jgi:GNAT superfamily N-acetyltransferase
MARGKLPNFLVRPARPEDGQALARLRAALWPESSAEEHFKELEPILAGRPTGILPLIYLVAESGEGGIVAFIEAALRSYADGCDPSLPVGYVEGWYVIEELRRQGIGKALLQAGGLGAHPGVQRNGLRFRAGQRHFAACPQANRIPGGWPRAPVPQSVVTGPGNGADGLSPPAPIRCSRYQEGVSRSVSGQGFRYTALPAPRFRSRCKRPGG